MSTHVTPDRPTREGARQGEWHAPPEAAPSRMREDESFLGWTFGTLGLSLLVLGILAMLFNRSGSTSGFVLAVTNVLGPGWSAFLMAVGLMLLLFHAATDGGLQIRRTYAVFGFAWLATAVVFFLIMAATRGVGLFAPGYACLGVGLLFLMAALRHETDAEWRTRAVLVIGGIGAVLALVGFVGSNVGRGDFLVPFGFLLALMGLAYLWAFAGMQGTNTNLGYRAGQAIGLLGLLVFAVAMARTVLPPLFFSWHWLSPPAPAPYLIPTGLLLMGLGALYACVSAALCSDSRIVVLTRRELAAFFYSPIAYIVTCAFTLVSLWTFWSFLEYLVRGEEFGRTGPVMEPIVRFYIIRWEPIIVILILGVPVVTMHLLSEEKRSGTLESLLTAPVNETSVVLSKFLAAFIFFMLLWIPWGFFLVALRIWGQEPFDYRPLLSFGVALACSGAGFIAMGLFFSSLVRSQIASAVLTTVGMVILTFIYFAWDKLERASPTSAWVPVLKHCSYINLWLQSLEGLLVVRLLLFPLSLAIFCLFLTATVLNARRWS